MKKLKNAPLQEVIFEAKWDLDLDSDTQQPQDIGFEFALGKFQNAISDEFPMIVRKFPNELPYQLFNHKVLYQFWKSENTWPVLQFGPGIFSLNDTEKNYVWEYTYYPALIKALERLISSYPKSRKLNFIAYSLRYIDVVPIKEYSFDSWPKFIQDNINFSFENLFDTRGKLKQFQFQQTFEMSNGSGLQITISNGINKKDEPVFIWQTAVTGHKKTNKAGLLDWVQNAHDVTSEVFKDICKDNFYASFNQ